MKHTLYRLMPEFYKRHGHGRACEKLSVIEAEGQKIMRGTYSDIRRYCNSYREGHDTSYVLGYWVDSTSDDVYLPV